MHNTSFFGLAKEDDCGLMNKKRNQWCMPTREEHASNSQHMKEVAKIMK